MNITMDDDGRVPGDPRERREEVASEIAAREHAAIIAEGVKAKLERYIALEIFSTEKDDHTRSLSERVTILEKELGELRFEAQWKRRDEWRQRARRRWWHFGRHP